MLSAALILVSLLLGYVVVVALTLASTFALVHYLPRFTVEGHRLRARYKLLQDFLWFLYSAIGGYLALVVARDASLPLTAALLAAVLIYTIWKNSEEARQVGLLYMLLTSASIAAGIAAAYIVRARQIG